MRPLFVALIRRHERPLAALVRNRIGSVDSVPDVLQETLLQVWTGLRHHETPKRVRPWILQVARNRCRDFLRSRQRREIFVCVLVHLGWTVAAAGCAMGTADLGFWRWLLPATLLLLGLLQALLAWLVQGGGGHGGGDHGGGAAPARARVDGFTTPQKSGVTPGGKRGGPGLARRDVAGQLLRNLHVLTFAASVLDLPILLGGNSRRDHGYDLARDTKHRYKRLAIFVTRRLAPSTCKRKC